MILPTQAAAVLPLAAAFTAPTFRRFATLALAALLTTGRRRGSGYPRCGDPALFKPPRKGLECAKL
jgi:hypothetical protein